MAFCSVAGPELATVVHDFLSRLTIDFRAQSHLKRSGFETEQHVRNLNMQRDRLKHFIHLSPNVTGRGVRGNSAKFGLMSLLRHIAFQMEQHIGNINLGSCNVLTASPNLLWVRFTLY